MIVASHVITSKLINLTWSSGWIYFISNFLAITLITFSLIRTSTNSNLYGQFRAISPCRALNIYKGFSVKSYLMIKSHVLVFMTYDHLLANVLIFSSSYSSRSISPSTSYIAITMSSLLLVIDHLHLSLLIIILLSFRYYSYVIEAF